MLINADFSRRATVNGDEYLWSTSPQQGVERVMLDRVGEEKARATSIVRYAPSSHFPRHKHPGGEEILVLSGTFSDEDGDYPTGWYLRNPPGTSHQPFSEQGATIFVKLWQMDTSDHTRVRIDTRNPMAWQQSDGREICALYSGNGEQVSLQRLAAGERLFHAPLEGAELLILEGELMTDERPLCQGSWIRLPAGAYPEFFAGPRGTTFYLKVGPLGKTTLEF